MLKEQAHISREQHPQGSYLKELSMKAQTVLPLAKPLPMILSVTKISSGYLKDLEIGAVCKLLGTHAHCEEEEALMQKLTCGDAPIVKGGNDPLDANFVLRVVDDRV